MDRLTRLEGLKYTAKKLEKGNDRIDRALNLYRATGKDKWKECIDARHHEAAEKACSEGKIKHPGEYYNYQWKKNGDLPEYRGEKWTAFQKADQYVCKLIKKGKPLNAKEYFDINNLLSEGTSEILRGARKEDKTWGLENPSDEKIKILQGKRLIDGQSLTVEPIQGRYVVKVPESRDEMMYLVGKLFLKYDEDEVKAGLAAVTELYEALELLHPTEDFSSRTNHLILNRLLAEHGLPPAILREPNTPELSYEGATEFFADAIDAGISVALKQTDKDVNQQIIEQKKREIRVLEDEMVEAFMGKKMKKYNQLEEQFHALKRELEKLSGHSD